MQKEQLSERVKKLKTELELDKLIAVTKYSPVEDLVMAYELGLTQFGENRVQDLEDKASYFHEHNLHEVKWFFIGNLQSNKVKKLLDIPGLVAIHSISSLKLLSAILKRDSELTSPIDLFLQVNTSFEDEKSGFESLEEVQEAIALFNESSPKNFRLKGLMTMGKIRTDDFEKDAHLCFSRLADMKKELGEDLSLSMGMSRDYHIALEHGADFVRIGSQIFK